MLTAIAFHSRIIYLDKGEKINASFNRNILAKLLWWSKMRLSLKIFMIINFIKKFLWDFLLDNAVIFFNVIF